MLDFSHKTKLFAMLVLGVVVLSGCGSSNAPDQRRVTSNPFAPSKGGGNAPRMQRVQPAQASQSSPSSEKLATTPSVTQQKQKMEQPVEEPATVTDILAETSKRTLDSTNPGVGIIIRGVGDKITEVLPGLQKTLAPMKEEQKQPTVEPAEPQLEHFVVDQQLVLILRPAPADLFAFAQKLKFGTIKEIDVQKRIITLEAQLPQLVALAESDPGKMESDVKVSANADTLKNMKPETPASSTGDKPEKKPATVSKIGTDRDLKPRPGEETIDWALRVIAGTSSFAHDTACKKLVKMKPDAENLERVSSLLASTLPQAKEGFRMEEHVNAMAVWYTDESARAFAKLLENENSFLVREEIIELLPTIHSETMAEVLVGRLSNREDMKDARRALQIMGAIAEKPVLQLLDDPDSDLRIEACNILQSIGTAKAIPALKQRAETEDNRVVKKLLLETQAEIQKKLPAGGN